MKFVNVAEVVVTTRASVGPGKGFWGRGESVLWTGSGALKPGRERKGAAFSLVSFGALCGLFNIYCMQTSVRFMALARSHREY